MLLKRLAVVVISLVLGFLITWGILIIPYVGTNLEEYGVTYTFFTTLSIACAIGVWLDLLLGAEILPK